LFYVASDRNIEKSALFIKNTLEEIWIYIELHPISITWLSNVLARQDEYDMILAGIDLWYFSHNIFPYFHSSQVKNGYNFSNIKKALLDNNLKDLKESFKNKEKKEEIQIKVLNILKEEQVVKTLYSPKQKLIVDKNIHISPFPTILQSKNMRTVLYDKLYTNEKRVINVDWKNIFWFFKYIIEIL
jgi:ABC-type oligopeptide transport system substrate-binding subunit